MKRLLILVLFISGFMQVNALVISEVMSNPTGVDDGREWIEIYNNSTSSIDLSHLTVSIKGGSAVVTTPLQGGTTLAPNEYAIIGSVVSGSTKFLQDYPNYLGILFKSSIGLVNTGVTSVDIKLDGVNTDSISSYTAAKEGYTLSLVNGTFTLSSPTPGSENQVSIQDSLPSSSNSTTTENQTTITQMSLPSPDIILYMPFDKTVIAGAEANFATYGMTRAGRNIDGLTCLWAFGDGGRALGATTTYTYAYPGRYIAQVEGSNNYISGIGRMNVRVVAPDIAITKIGSGKYGTYVDIFNPNNYELDLSQWRLSIDGSSFPFPKNTLIAGNSTTHFSGLAMGFASTTINGSSTVKILFPNMEEVTRYVPEMIKEENVKSATSSTTTSSTSIAFKRPAVKSIQVLATTTQTGNSIKPSYNKKDTRIISFFKELFGR